MKDINVFWSFRSPYSYLAAAEILDLAISHNVKLNIRVVFPIAIRNPEILFNKSNPNQVKYILLDWERRAEFLGLPHAWPSPDPVVMDFEEMTIPQEQPYIYRLSYLGVEAQRRGCAPEFITEVSKLIFGGTKNWHEGDHLAQASKRAGLDLESMDLAIASEESYSDEIQSNHKLLEESGHWGVPTLVFEGEPFFGQDRLETLRWRLNQYGLAKA